MTTWDAGFEAGWTAHEKHAMEEHEVLLGERNAARSEVERLKSELQGFQKAEQDRQEVLGEVRREVDTDRQQRFQKEAEAAERQALTEEELSGAREEVERLKSELQGFRKAEEARLEVLSQVRREVAEDREQRAQKDAEATQERAVLEDELHGTKEELRSAKAELRGLRTELRLYRESEQHRREVLAAVDGNAG